MDQKKRKNSGLMIKQNNINQNNKINLNCINKLNSKMLNKKI